MNDLTVELTDSPQSAQNNFIQFTFSLIDKDIVIHPSFWATVSTDVDKNN